MRRNRSNPRAQRILAAAAQEFSEYGYAGARIERISNAADVNKQLVFYYFQSKRGLHTCVVREAAERLGNLVASLVLDAATPQRRLEQLLVGQFDVLVKERGLAAVLGRGAKGDGSGPLAPAVRRLVTVIAEGQGRGAFRDDIDPHLLALQALVLQLGFLEFEPILAASAIPLAADESSLAERWKTASAKLIVRGAQA